MLKLEFDSFSKWISVCNFMSIISQIQLMCLWNGHFSVYGYTLAQRASLCFTSCAHDSDRVHVELGTLKIRNSYNRKLSIIIRNFIISMHSIGCLLFTVNQDKVATVQLEKRRSSSENKSVNIAQMKSQLIIFTLLNIQHFHPIHEPLEVFSLIALGADQE